MKPKLILDRFACLVVGRNELPGVRAAANALAGDIEEACGARIPVVTRRTDRSRLVIYIETERELARRFGCDGHLDAPERFILRSLRVDGRDSVLISGSDELGTIHGIYHFSQTHLGTDPLKFWTGYRPTRRARIPLRDVDHDSVTPTFRFRGFHLERIDDIHGWKSADGKAGFHVFWEKVFETLLRLRGNMVKPGTNEPTSREVALAQKMGLMVTQEHGAPLGSWGGSVRTRDRKADYSFRKNRKAFLAAWDASIRSYPRPENVIWTIGFRGRGDNPFWIDDPSAKTDAARGAIITEVLQAQVDLVKRRCGRFKPTFIHNLWMEGVRLYREGHVKVPAEAHIVWADNGYGTYRAMLAAGCDPSQMCPALPGKPTRGKHGVYYHVSMYDANAPDLAQFVPPKRIRREFTRVMAKEATFYLLVNVGRLREQVLGAAAVMEVARDAQPWVDPKRDGAEDFWRRWCEKYSGKHARAVRECYDHLYETPFQWGTWGGWDDYVVGDHGYYRRARYLVLEALSAPYRKTYEALPLKFWLGKPMTLAEQAAYLRGVAEKSQTRWDRAVPRAAVVARRLRGAAREFFEGKVQAQIEIHSHSNRYLLHMIDAVLAYEAQKFPAAEQSVRRALECVEAILRSMKLMERGRWRGWCKTNYWSGWEIARSTAEMFLRVISEFQLVRRG